MARSGGAMVAPPVVAGGAAGSGAGGADLSTTPQDYIVDSVLKKVATEAAELHSVVLPLLRQHRQLAGSPAPAAGGERSPAASLTGSGGGVRRSPGRALDASAGGGGGATASAASSFVSAVESEGGGAAGGDGGDDDDIAEPREGAERQRRELRELPGQVREEGRLPAEIAAALRAGCDDVAALATPAALPDAAAARAGLLLSLQALQNYTALPPLPTLCDVTELDRDRARFDEEFRSPPSPRDRAAAAAFHSARAARHSGLLTAALTGLQSRADAARAAEEATGVAEALAATDAAEAAESLRAGVASRGDEAAGLREEVARAAAAVDDAARGAAARRDDAARRRAELAARSEEQKERLAHTVRECYTLIASARQQRGEWARVLGELDALRDDDAAAAEADARERAPLRAELRRARRELRRREEGAALLRRAEALAAELREAAEPAWERRRRGLAAAQSVLLSRQADVYAERFDALTATRRGLAELLRDAERRAAGLAEERERKETLMLSASGVSSIVARELGELDAKERDALAAAEERRGQLRGAEQELADLAQFGAGLSDRLRAVGVAAELPQAASSPRAAAGGYLSRDELMQQVRDQQAQIQKMEEILGGRGSGGLTSSALRASGAAAAPPAPVGQHPPAGPAAGAAGRAVPLVDFDGISASDSYSFFDDDGGGTYRAGGGAGTSPCAGGRGAR